MMAAQPQFFRAFKQTTTMQSSFDRRRVNGPEESHLPVYESDEEPESSSMAARRNGRSAKDVRPICASTFILPQFTRKLVSDNVSCFKS